MLTFHVWQISHWYSLQEILSFSSGACLCCPRRYALFYWRLWHNLLFLAGLSPREVLLGSYLFTTNEVSCLQLLLGSKFLYKDLPTMASCKPWFFWSSKMLSVSGLSTPDFNSTPHQILPAVIIEKVFRLCNFFLGTQICLHCEPLVYHRDKCHWIYACMHTHVHIFLYLH